MRNLLFLSLFLLASAYTKPCTMQCCVNGFKSDEQCHDETSGTSRNCSVLPAISCKDADPSSRNYVKIERGNSGPYICIDDQERHPNLTCTWIKVTESCELQQYIAAHHCREHCKLPSNNYQNVCSLYPVLPKNDLACIIYSKGIHKVVKLSTTDQCTIKKNENLRLDENKSRHNFNRTVHVLWDIYCAATLESLVEVINATISWMLKDGHEVHLVEAVNAIIRQVLQKCPDSVAGDRCSVNNDQFALRVVTKRRHELSGYVVTLPGKGNENTELAIEDHGSLPTDKGNYTLVALFLKLPIKTREKWNLTSGILHFGVYTERNEKRSVAISFKVAISQDSNPGVPKVPAYIEPTKEVTCEARPGIDFNRTKHRKEMICAYWDESYKNWKSGGCTTHPVFTGSSHARCRCNHTTNFAILMRQSVITVANKCQRHQFVLSTISSAGCAISILFLIVMLGLYAYLRRRLWSDRTAIHVFLVGTLLVAQVVFLASAAAKDEPVACRLVAILLHFSYTAVFSWHFVEGIHLFRKVVKVYGSETSKMCYYFPIGFGIPTVIVTITVAVDLNGYGTEHGCWLSTKAGLVWAFIGPVLGIMVVNVCILAVVLRIIVKSGNIIPGGNSLLHQVRAATKGALVLLPILGISWIFGFFVDHHVVFQYLFSILNSTQGFFIFLFHFVLNSEARQAFNRKQAKSKAMRDVGAAYPTATTKFDL